LVVLTPRIASSPTFALKLAEKVLRFLSVTVALLVNVRGDNLNPCPIFGVHYTLRDIMVVEQTPDWTLRAKTGWSTRMTPSIGWYVGYVETHDETWVFALNLDLRDADDLPLRAALTRAALQAKGVID
ncbi:hypothetical protein G3480_25740, partial [Thiorhodococcus mannitoliphagus]